MRCVLKLPHAQSRTCRWRKRSCHMLRSMPRTSFPERCHKGAMLWLSAWTHPLWRIRTSCAYPHCAEDALRATRPRAFRCAIDGTCAEEAIAQYKHRAHPAHALRAHSSATEGRFGVRWSTIRLSAECASDGRKWGKNAGRTAAQRGAVRKLVKPCAECDALMQSARNADTAAEIRDENRPDHRCTGCANFVCILCCTMSDGDVYYKSSA